MSEQYTNCNYRGSLTRGCLATSRPKQSPCLAVSPDLLWHCRPYDLSIPKQEPILIIKCSITNSSSSLMFSNNTSALDICVNVVLFPRSVSCGGLLCFWPVGRHTLPILSQWSQGGCAALRYPSYAAGASKQNAYKKLFFHSDLVATLFTHTDLLATSHG